MRKYAVHLCSFTTGLDELSGAEQRDPDGLRDARLPLDRCSGDG